MRDNLLKWIEKYRNDGFHIFYQDETWVFKNMAPGRSWQFQSNLNSSPTDRKVPPGQGDRSIVAHIGSDITGLSNNCLLLFTGRKRAYLDYHSEMKQDVFINWLDSKVFPEIKRLGQKSVVVLDRAKYHTMLTENTKPPVMAWNKTKMVDKIKT